MNYCTNAQMHLKSFDSFLYKKNSSVQIKRTTQATSQKIENDIDRYTNRYQKLIDRTIRVSCPTLQNHISGTLSFIEILHYLSACLYDGLFHVRSGTQVIGTLRISIDGTMDARVIADFNRRAKQKTSQWHFVYRYTTATRIVLYDEQTSLLWSSFFFFFYFAKTKELYTGHI